MQIKDFCRRTQVYRLLDFGTLESVKMDMRPIIADSYHPRRCLSPLSMRLIRQPEVR
jgi:hypothetical protein